MCREFKFDVLPPLYMPFHNVWCSNAYYRYDGFTIDPFTIYSSSTSGSPVVLTGNQFFRFLNEEGGVFSYDGRHTFTVKCPAGQKFYYCENCDPYAEWQKYNDIIIGRIGKEATDTFVKAILEWRERQGK